MLADEGLGLFRFLLACYKFWVLFFVLLHHSFLPFDTTRSTRGHGECLHRDERFLSSRMCNTNMGTAMVKNPGSQAKRAKIPIF